MKAPKGQKTRRYHTLQPNVKDATCLVHYLDSNNVTQPRQNEEAIQTAVFAEEIDYSTIIPAVLDTSNMSLRNSLVLSKRDRKSFDFLRNSDACRFETKDREWSTMQFITGKMASEDPTVMRLALALASVQMGRMEHGTSYEELEGFVHYNAAVQDILATISQPVTDEFLVVKVFLLSHYEKRFGDRQTSVLEPFPTLRYILEGGGLLKQIVNQIDSTEPCSLVRTHHHQHSHQPITYIASRLLWWMALHDLQEGIIGTSGGSLYTYLNSHHLLDYLFVLNRSAGGAIWGDTYPPDQLLDDVENTPGFYLLHDIHKAMYGIIQLQRMERSYPEWEKLSANIASTLDRISMQHSSMFAIAELINQPRLRRAILNLQWIVALYHSCRLFYHRIAHEHERRGEKEEASLRSIMKYAHQSQQIPHHQNTTLYSMSVALFVAGLETDDPIHRQWIQDRFQAIEPWGKNVQHMHALMNRCIAEQLRLHRRVNHLLRDSPIAG